MNFFEGRLPHRPYKYNPDDFGPGKGVTAEMAEAFIAHNAHKIIIMLMLRLKQPSVLIDASDVINLASLPEGSALLTQCVAEGVRLHIAGPGVAASLRRDI